MINSTFFSSVNEVVPLILTVYAGVGEYELFMTLAMFDVWKCRVHIFLNWMEPLYL
jgi:hypothetical protein